MPLVPREHGIRAIETKSAVGRVVSFVVGPKFWLTVGIGGGHKIGHSHCVRLLTKFLARFRTSRTSPVTPVGPISNLLSMEIVHKIRPTKRIPQSKLLAVPNDALTR